jgi:hypothetical protein
VQHDCAGTEPISDGRNRPRQPTHLHLRPLSASLPVVRIEGPGAPRFGRRHAGHRYAAIFGRWSGTAAQLGLPPADLAKLTATVTATTATSPGQKHTSATADAAATSPTSSGCYT